MRRREFIAGLGGTVAAWPVVARAQQSAMPVIGFVQAGSLAGSPARYLSAFRAGLGEIGFVEGQNVAVEYHWIEGYYNGLPALMADLVGRRVAVIATVASTPATLAAKVATSSIPIVFGVGDDPVKMGLVARINRPGGNATGVNFFNQEVVAKRLSLLHQFVPTATRVAVVTFPANENTTFVLKQLEDAASILNLQLHVYKAGTIKEIDAAFESMVRDHIGALFVAPDTFLASRSVQFATLAARNRFPASYSSRADVEARGLVSYGADISDAYRLAGTYVGRILKGANPADLPVVQSTKFELVINIRTARALGIEVPSTLLAIADEVIE
jgi:putative ABC transport system substrate-binding protein